MPEVPLRIILYYILGRLDPGVSWFGVSWLATVQKPQHTTIHKQQFLQSPHSDYVTRCYFNLCLQQGSRDDRVSRDVFSFLYV